MASAAATLKRITLELGGNDASIVLDDVDPKTGRARHFRECFPEFGQVASRSSGSMCMSCIYDEICNELVAIAKSPWSATASNQGTKLGPLQNRMQYERVKVPG